jgi:rRNA-processing protein FCF1
VAIEDPMALWLLVTTPKKTFLSAIFTIRNTEVARSRMNVLCDTSFLMVLVSRPISQFEKVEMQLGKLNFLIPDVVIEELKKLEKRTGPKRSLLAKTAIEISNSKFRIIELPTYRQVDDAIIEYAKATKCAVATLDKNLKSKLQTFNTLVITLSSNRLVIVYPPRTIF